MFTEDKISLEKQRIFSLFEYKASMIMKIIQNESGYSKELLGQVNFFILFN
jgi:hypothetical protein